jgi:hypothetical protein
MHCVAASDLADLGEDFDDGDDVSVCCARRSFNEPILRRSNLRSCTLVVRYS